MPIPDLKGRTMLVTGGTNGIGLATATALASAGARVGVVGRDPDRGRAAVESITSAHGSEVRLFTADLSRQDDVRRLAREVEEAFGDLTVLVNNAGGYWAHRHLTADGLEWTFAVNHLAPYLLTRLLVPRLVANAPARVVTVSSGAQAMGRIDLADPQSEHRYSGQRAYNASKLANVLFTYELARRLEGTGVTANTLHPGVVRTSFGKQDAGRWMAALTGVVAPFMKSPEDGARTSVYLASASEVATATGAYYANAQPRRSSASSYDEGLAAELWRVSAELVDLPDQLEIGSP